MKWIRGFYGLLRTTIDNWVDHRVPQLGAALAFYTALSIAPMLVLSIRIASRFFGDEAIQGTLQTQLTSLLGDQGAQAVQSLIASPRRASTGALATIVSIGTLLFAGSGVFLQLHDSLNFIYRVRVKPGRPIFALVRDRFLSFAAVLVIAFLLLVSLVVSSALASVATMVDQLNLPSEFDGALQKFDLLVSFFVVMVLFALMFKLLPDARLAWRDLWLGALVTSGLFTIGKIGISMYIGRAGIASSYGVAGSFVVLLVWVYYSAQIFYFGAELTHAYASRFGRGIQPSRNAEFVDPCDPGPGAIPPKDAAGKSGR
jgi:membrane protein